MLSALPIFASLLAPSAEAATFKVVRIDTSLQVSSDEICGNLKDDDLDGLVDEKPCITGDLENPWDQVGSTAGPGGSTFIPWEDWLVAFDDTDGTLSVYELYSVRQTGKTRYEYTFERVVSDIDTIGLATDPTEVTVGVADLDSDGYDDLALGFGDYAGGYGVMVGYDLTSGLEQSAYAYTGYVYSHSSSLNIVDTALLDSEAGRLLVDVGYADYYGSGYGWFKAVDANAFGTGSARSGQWALVDQEKATVSYR